MAKFKVIISDPDESQSKVVELDGARAVPLISRRLGEIVDGAVVGFSGSKLQITGGSDKDGFPMRSSVHGGVRVRIVVSKGFGFHPKEEGQRKRKTFRGNIITEEIVQVNMKVVEKAEKAQKAEKAKKKKKETETETEEKLKSEEDSAAVKSGGELSEGDAQAT
jgi:small subunit ribosomal protein S6e